MKNRLVEYCKNCNDKGLCNECCIKETKTYIEKLKQENKLLKSKEKPKKVKITTINSEYGSYHCECPICGQFLSINFKPTHTKYCEKCGNRLGWNIGLDNE